MLLGEIAGNQRKLTDYVLSLKLIITYTNYVIIYKYISARISMHACKFATFLPALLFGSTFFAWSQIYCCFLVSTV